MFLAESTRDNRAWRESDREHAGMDIRRSANNLNRIKITCINLAEV